MVQELHFRIIIPIIFLQNIGFDNKHSNPADYTCTMKIKSYLYKKSPDFKIFYAFKIYYFGYLKVNTELLCTVVIAWARIFYFLQSIYIILRIIWVPGRYMVHFSIK